MTTFYVYQANSLAYLGQLEAIDSEAADALASVLWRQPHKLTSFRLTFNRQVIAA